MKFWRRGILALVCLSALGLEGTLATEAHSDALEQAVSARSAIEKVYWSYRDWPESNEGGKPSFEEIADRARIEAQWGMTLLKRDRLSKRWGVEITPEMLQQELDRISGSSAQPERLAAVFAALDNDPVTIAEYFILPILVDRHFRTYFANDPFVVRVCTGLVRARAV